MPTAKVQRTAQGQPLHEKKKTAVGQVEAGKELEREREREREREGGGGGGVQRTEMLASVAVTCRECGQS